jgi:hypothetical protein
MKARIRFKQYKWKLPLGSLRFDFQQFYKMITTMKARTRFKQIKLKRHIKDYLFLYFSLGNVPKLEQ